MPAQSTARPHINPTGALESIREILDILTAADAAGDTAEVVVQGLELAEQIDELDRWLTGGGAMPAPWRDRADAHVEQTPPDV